MAESPSRLRMDTDDALTGVVTVNGATGAVLATQSPSKPGGRHLAILSHPGSDRGRA